jgi:hypothetical protein
MKTTVMVSVRAMAEGSLVLAREAPGVPAAPRD